MLTSEGGRCLARVASAVVACSTASHAVAQPDLLVNMSGGETPGVRLYDGATGVYQGLFDSGFVFDRATGMAQGPSGDLYLAFPRQPAEGEDCILRFDGTTGAFVSVFATGGGLEWPQGITFGPDGNLYVVEYNGRKVIRFDGRTGGFIDVFVTGDLAGPTAAGFGPDGDLYVISRNENCIKRFDGTTGSYTGVFIGGIPEPSYMLFAPNGVLYVSTTGGVSYTQAFDSGTGAFLGNLPSHASGANGMACAQGMLYLAIGGLSSIERVDADTGAYIDTFVTPGSGGLVTPSYILLLAAPTCALDLTDAREQFLEPTPGSFIVTEGATIRATVRASDTDSAMLWASLSGLPPEAELTEPSGTVPFETTLQWTPTQADAAVAPYEVGISVTDHQGETSVCVFWIEDINLKPIGVVAESEISVEAQGTDGAWVTLDGAASHDPDADDLVFHWDASDTQVQLIDAEAPVTDGLFPIGTTTATLTVSDGRGGAAVRDVVVHVQDTTAPEVECTTDVAMLWPARHDMRTVSVHIMVSDAVSDPQLIVPVYATIRSDEPDDAIGTGDGSTTGDVNGLDGFDGAVDITPSLVFDPLIGANGAWTTTVQLRAERDGTGDGRTYTIDIEVIDSHDNPATTSCVVVCPHDRRRR
jgi:hypothetical protein